MESPKKHINIFLAYSRKDAAYVVKLKTYLRPLARRKTIKIWYDGDIVAGSEWEEAIKKHLHQADIILLLVSADALDSDYFYEHELPDALARHEAKTAKVIPIILRRCAWTISDFSHLQALPKNGKPINEWDLEEKAYTNIVEELHKSIADIYAQRRVKIEAEQQRIRDEQERKKQEARAKKQQQQLFADAQQAEREKQRKATAAQQRKQAQIDQAKKIIGDKRLGYGAMALLSLVLLFWIVPQISGFFEKKELTETEKKEIVEGIEQNMVSVEGGTFKMGCDEKRDGNCEDYEKPVHDVTLDNFKIGKYEVTQEEWEAIMGENPSHFKGCAKCPVEKVSWEDTQDFIKKLNQATGKQFRLPTEAEWEFAARGGTKSKDYKYAGSNDLDEVAWYRDNGGKKTHEVGTKKANELGIYDMSGNVWEWCSDWYNKDFYKNPPKTNPENTTKASYRVLRGGSFSYNSINCRSANRNLNLSPTNRISDLGLRLAQNPL